MDDNTKPDTKYHAVSPLSRTKLFQVLGEMRADLTGTHTRHVIKTAKDYHPGRPMNNAEVFMALCDWSFHGVDDEGILAEKESAGSFRFGTIRNMLRKTDVHKRLSLEDAEDAVAMVYHLMPSLDP